MKNVHTTVTEEYQALRGDCALIDYEGAALLAIDGPDAIALLGEITTRSVDFLLDGQSSVALMLREDGTVVSELTVHCRSDDYLVEIWPAQAEEGRAHLLAYAAGYPDVTVTDLSDIVRVLALEGPASFKIVDELVPVPVSSLSYLSYSPGQWQDVPLQISRSGVTGEYGYKIYVDAEQADRLATDLLTYGAVPVGTDALDIARMEMRFLNLEREAATGGATPLHLGVQWMVDFEQEFTGKKALTELRGTGEIDAPVCFAAPAAAADDAVPGQGLEVEGTRVGTVVAAVTSPALDQVIGTATVDESVAASGQEFALKGADATVRTVSAPFLIPASFAIPME